MDGAYFHWDFQCTIPTYRKHYRPPFSIRSSVQLDDILWIESWEQEVRNLSIFVVFTVNARPKPPKSPQIIKSVCFFIEQSKSFGNDYGRKYSYHITYVFRCHSPDFNAGIYNGVVDTLRLVFPDFHYFFLFSTARTTRCCCVANTESSVTEGRTESTRSGAWPCYGNYSENRVK